MATPLGPLFIVEFVNRSSARISASSPFPGLQVLWSVPIQTAILRHGFLISGGSTPSAAKRIIDIRRGQPLGTGEIVNTPNSCGSHSWPRVLQVRLSCGGISEFRGFDPLPFYSNQRYPGGSTPLAISLTLAFPRRLKPNFILRLNGTHSTRTSHSSELAQGRLDRVVPKAVHCCVLPQAVKAAPIQNEDLGSQRKSPR